MNLTIVRPVPSTAPLNGLPGWKPYVYRGTGSDTLTAFMDEPESQFENLPGGRPLAPCGTPGAYRRHYRRGEPVDEECRQAGCRDKTDRNRKRRAS